jgi:hypothetical protein
LRKYEDFRKRVVFGKSGTQILLQLRLAERFGGGAKLFFSKNKNLNLHDNS